MICLAYKGLRPLHLNVKRGFHGKERKGDFCARAKSVRSQGIIAAKTGV